MLPSSALKPTKHLFAIWFICISMAGAGQSGAEQQTMAAPNGSAPQHAGPDGFSICPFESSPHAKSPREALAAMKIGSCQPLTDQAMQSFGLSSSQTTLVATLQSFAVKQNFDLFQQIAKAKSLAAPKPFVVTDDYSDYWFPDAENPDNVPLGIHLRYWKENGKPELYQMTYTVDGNEGHFTVLWNRAALTAPQP